MPEKNGLRSTENRGSIVVNHSVNVRQEAAMPEQSQKKCPKCAEMIPFEANICGHCRTKQPQKSTPFFSALAATIVLVPCVLIGMCAIWPREKLDSPCRIVRNLAPTFYAYCPADTPAKDVHKFLLFQKHELFYETSENQIHFYVFNDEKVVPRNEAAFAKMPENTISESQIALMSINDNTKHYQFMCRKNPGKLSDCSAEFPKK